MMRQYLIFLLPLLLLALGCQNETCAEERGLIPIEDYISNNNLTLQDTVVNGITLFYDIQDPGNDERPTLDSDVTIVYQGRETNDDIFDETPMGPDDPGVSRFPLARLIPGWQIGLTLIGEGGRMTLYIPTELAYGPRGAGDAVCPNSDLIFDIELRDVAN